MTPSTHRALLRLDAALQRFAERAFRLIPPPLEVDSLEPLRAAHAERIFARRRHEVARAQQLFLTVAAGPALAVSDAPFGGNPGLAAIAKLAAEMTTELRLEMAHATRGRMLGLAARVDAALPTEAMELLDDPACDEAVRTGIIRSLDRINRVLGSYVRFLDVLDPLLAKTGTTTILDVASGHGGFPLAVAPLARARGQHLHIIASDVRAEYLDVGRARAGSLGETDVEFRVADAFRLGDAVAPGEVDVITCTQTIHHFGAGPLAALLASSLLHARRGVLFIDPLRALTRLAGIGALSWLTSFDRHTVHDSVISIRKCFVPEELRLIARCVPGGDSLEAFYLKPGFVVLRSRQPAR